MKHKPFIVAFIIITAVCLLICLCLASVKNGDTAEIYSNGTLIRSIDLADVTDSYDFNVTHDGHNNIIHVEKNRISVISADCPDKLCVRQGAIQNSLYPIVCLPNKLIVKITENNKNTDMPDAVSK